MLEGGTRLTLPLVLGPERAEVIFAKYGLRAGPLSESDVPETEINSLGFTKPDFSPRKPAHVFRILMLGGSAAAGQLSSELRAALEKQCPKAACEVIDGGMGGAVSSQERYHLKRWLDYDPDLVVIYDGWNDMYYSHYTPERYLRETDKMKEMENNWNSPSRWLARHSALLQTLKMGRVQWKKRMGSGVAWAQAVSDPVMQVSWMGGMTEAVLRPDGEVQDHFSKSYEENLKAMGRELRKRDIRAVFILQPSLSEWIKADRPASLGVQTLLESFKPWVRQDWLKAAGILIPKARSAQHQAGKDHGFPVWDFSHLSGLDPDFFSDFVHLSTDGNRWMASHLLQRLTQAGLLGREDLI